MNKREQQARSARQLLSDERLVAFLRAVDEMGNCNVLAVELICQALDKGKSLNEIFYDGNDFGYLLSVEKTSASNFKIEFGCHAGPLTGDCGEWEVSFVGDTVQSISGGLMWIS
jgi:hypothetical protein